jgi:hypothetical protein
MTKVSNSDPRFIKALAHVLDPKLSGVTEEEIEILKTEYAESEKDENGYIYIMRSYQPEGAQLVIMTKKHWSAVRVAFYGGTAEEHKKAKEIFREMDEEYTRKLDEA